MTETDGYYAPLVTQHTFQPYAAWRVLVGTIPCGKWVTQYHNLFHPQGTRGYERRYFDDEAGALADAADFGCTITKGG